ncbi:MAG: cob(I)yrinic acid a,c-diamide adenosyltransferase [Oscillospiraceae bacterium]|nr:cob(I)yrinic acid a,c-diamide adenosyltransferase [Oscillospiraceae bacterium]
MSLLHIYCGNGKGKTTAALGLTMRAAGSGMKVHVVQFLKGSMTSELTILDKIPGVTVERCDKNYGFTINMSAQDKEQLILCHNRLLENALEKMNSGETGMIVLDEFNDAYSLGLFDTKLADRLVLERNDKTEVVLTGRDPDKKFCDTADYISEIKCIRHPFEKGIPARKGIEY